MGNFYFGGQKVCPSTLIGGGIGDGFTETFGENIYHLYDDKDSNGLIPFFIVNNTEMVIDKIKKIPPSWCNYIFYGCTSLTSVSLPSLITVSGIDGCSYMFSGCTSLTSISLPNLTKVSGYRGCNNMFYGCTSLTSASLPSLTTISGYSGCNNMFSGCTSLTSVSLPNLTTISGSLGCIGIFNGCTSLTDVYFPALTTSSFGSYTNQFNGLMGNTGNTTTHTLHFPSNLESTIQGLTTYPNFGGTSGYVVLAFDLPATS